MARRHHQGWLQVDEAGSHPGGSHHLRDETNLTRFYRRLARRKPQQVALMATARKMLKAIYWMVRNDEPCHYGPGVVNPTASPEVMTVKQR